VLMVMKGGGASHIPWMDLQKVLLTDGVFWVRREKALCRIFILVNAFEHGMFPLFLRALFPDSGQGF